MGERPTLVLARAHAMDRPGRTIDWMLVEGGLITAAGPGDPPDDLTNRATTLDLRPNTIIPALHDCHVHFLQTGLMEVDVDLGRAERFADVLALLDAAASDCAVRLVAGRSGSEKPRGRGERPGSQ